MDPRHPKDRLELRFDHYVLDGTPLEDNEWIVVELPGIGTKHGRFGGSDRREDGKALLVVYRNGEPESELSFPPPIAKVRRSTEEEVLEGSVETPEQNHDRVQAALEKIEAAQRLLAEASGELSPVLGYAEEWSAVGRVYDSVRQTWHTVDGRRVEIAAQTLRLGDDGGGDRYFLAGRPIHAGDVIELQTEDDSWQAARFEWTGLPDDPPTLHLDGGRTVPLPESTEHNLQLFRWPKK